MATTIMLGPARVEVRALNYEGWMPEGWQPGRASLGNTITIKARALDADPVVGVGDVNASHFFPPPGLAEPAPGWTHTRVALSVWFTFCTNFAGICSNYDNPSSPEGIGDDYWWPNGSSDPTQNDGVCEALLQSRDWGGMVELGGWGMWDTPEGAYPLQIWVPDLHAVAIPHDTDGDRLPDSYETYEAGLSAGHYDTDADGVFDANEDGVRVRFSRGASPPGSVRAAAVG